MPTSTAPSASGDLQHVYNRFPNSTSTTTRSKTSSTSRKVAKRKVKPVLIRAKTTLGPRYSLTVEFSNDGGKSFGPNLQAVPSHTYQLKMEFTQHQADPLLQGATFNWRLPAGWRFQDGHGAIQHEVCVSNPLIVTRIVRSPATLARTYVKILCPKVFS